MDCPRCANTLSQITANGVIVDACHLGCGGLWFDQGELKRFDEALEDAGPLLAVETDPDTTIDLDERAHCPSCGDQVMMRHFFSTHHEVEVDECPSCAGFWLDAGELARVRALFESEEESNVAAREAFRAEFGAQLDEIAAGDNSRAERFASLFRFICPSNYFGKAA
ncbi:MAG: zf-TFIIB domain-containing protein [Phycisphaerales bacterium]